MRAIENVFFFSNTGRYSLQIQAIETYVHEPLLFVALKLEMSEMEIIEAIE